MDKNSNNQMDNNKGLIHIGDNNYSNLGQDRLALLCEAITDQIYQISEDSYYSDPVEFKHLEKINFINNKINKYKESLEDFWRSNMVIDNMIINKEKQIAGYAAKIYARFNTLYQNNKKNYKDEENFGDLIIDLIKDEILKQIKDFHDLKNCTVDVGDLILGIEPLTFHAFYKCKILENPNDSK